MLQHLTHDVWHLVLQVATATLVGSALLMAWRDLMNRRRLPDGSMPPGAFRSGLLRLGAGKWHRGAAGGGGKDATDTIFVLPDISGYSALVAAYEHDIEKVKGPIFGLLNAMIDSAGSSLSLSKVDGDAVLFYADASASEPDRLGRTILRMVEAFDAEKSRSIDLHRADPTFADRLRALEIKIIIHRGRAARYEFGSGIDHFGAAVTLVYKLLKNTVADRRYVLRTSAARDDVPFPTGMIPRTRYLDAEELGRVRADVFALS